MVTEGMEVRSVGNTFALRETALIEAFNLKAAIEYALKNCQYLLYKSSFIENSTRSLDAAASEALTDMPPRDESELDPVTLHNLALMNMDSQPTEGFAKLQFLLQSNHFPPETFANALLLFCKFEVIKTIVFENYLLFSTQYQKYTYSISKYYDMAADLLAENSHLTFKYLTQVAVSSTKLSTFRAKIVCSSLNLTSLTPC